MSNELPFGDGKTMFNYNFTCVGGHSSSATLSSAFTITVPATANKIIMEAVTQNIRFTLDGTTPTATLGFRVIAGTGPLMVPVVPAQTVKVIEETASAVLQYQLGS
jgi:hypothetical protein